MFTQSNLDEFEARLDGAIQDDPENGVFRCRRDILTDEELFELEIKHIFEGNWIYMAHESQIPNPGDYFTLTMGRTPVVITRDKDGELHALVNACSHRGAQLCRFKRRNQVGDSCKRNEADTKDVYSPIVPIGFDGGNYFLIPPSGQLRKFSADALEAGRGVRALFAGTGQEVEEWCLSMFAYFAEHGR
jgi:hypothetical protein